MFTSYFCLTKAKLFLLLLLMPVCVMAGGISLNSTRIIYPQELKQSSVTVRNTDDKATFLVQSWVENSDGSKSRDFIVTPPLYTSAPGNENILRLMFHGNALPTDRESLYYFNTKAIPSVDKQALDNKNILILAAVTRIKLFVRPSGLKPSIEDAPNKLTFSREGVQLKISNASPYFLTLTDIIAGDQALESVMVPPMGEVLQKVPSGIRKISYSTINDYGAITPVRHVILK